MTKLPIWLQFVLVMALVLGAMAFFGWSYSHPP